jgi:uracil-DNA glycosylase
MSDAIPALFSDALTLAHASWQPVLRAGLAEVARASPAYLPELGADSFLPTEGRLFAAFSQPLENTRYVLVGEGPYPRAESATGYCFMDGAVNALWSEKGLSRQVNRATSLRNFMKMLLVADGHLKKGHTSGAAMEPVAAQANAPDSPWIQTRAALQDKLLGQGFLLLNAALVFRPHVPPLKEARAWQPLLQAVLAALATQAQARNIDPPVLVLWGKAAELLSALPANALFPRVVSEHPYNLSFIDHPGMQKLFGPMHLLQRADADSLHVK